MHVAISCCFYQKKHLCTLASVYDDLRQHFWLYYLLSDHRCLCAISLASRAVVLCLVICECERSSEAQAVWVRTRPARGRIVGSAGGFWKTKHCHLLMLLAAVSVVTHQKQTHTHTLRRRAHTLAHIIKVVDISVRPSHWQNTLQRSHRQTDWLNGTEYKHPNNCKKQTDLNKHNLSEVVSFLCDVPAHPYVSPLI